MGIVLCLIALFGYSYVPPQSERHAYMEVIDIGQGDAILLHFPNGQYWLMDGGGKVDLSRTSEQWKKGEASFEPGQNIVLPLLMKKGIHHLDAVVMSHANEDHVNGLAAVIARMPVRHVYFNGTINGSLKIKQVYADILKRHIPFVQIVKGDQFRMGKDGFVEVLNPDQPATTFFTKNQNERSIVLYVKMVHTTFLLTGDLDESSEPRVLQYVIKNQLIHRPLDILKVGHHGSKYASTVPFLEAWQPRVAVISVGQKNRYGHPSIETLKRLKQVGAAVFRTDQQGGICLEIQHKSFLVKTSR
jgi:competence protein ComEC